MRFTASSVMFSAAILLLIGGSTAQLGDNPDLRPVCQSDEECEAGPCDFSGPNPNDNPEWFYCTEPESCDPSAPRRVDGVCNNLAEGRRLEGSTGHLQLRRIEGTTETQFPPRDVSNTIVGFPGEIPNNFGGNILQVFTGQFIDHDLALTLPQEEGSFEIEADGGLEPIFFELSLGVRTEGNPPALPNENTCWIDLGTVYGGTLRDEELLRAFEDGLLNSVFVGDEEFLPLNSRIDEEVELEQQILPGNFAAGDIRVNENPVLTSIHTLFMREHNRLARQFAEEDSSLDDEEIYQLARKWNIAQWQNIVFNEWFFAWHREPLPEYRGYRPELRPEIDLVFSTATFRFGHTVLPNFIRRIQADGFDQTFLLGESFFRTSMVEVDGGVDTWLKGATRHCHQRVDNFIVESVRNRLFDDIPGADTLAEDLMVRNIQRARDHEIGRYVDIREFLNLTVPRTFDEVTGNQECITRRYESIYGVDNVDICDPIVCAFGEPATRGEVGETLFNNQREQFTRIRDGDRFYFENTNEDGPGFTQAEINTILNTGIADILRRNTLLNDRVGDENYVLDNGFQTEECCRTGGNDDADTICVLQNGRFVPEVLEEHCDALDRVEAGGAVFAGARGFDCECNQTPLPCIEQGRIDFLEVIESAPVAGLTIQQCQALCVDNDDCGAWTFDEDEGTCTIGSTNDEASAFQAVDGNVNSCQFRECRDCATERFVMVMDGCPSDGEVADELCADATDASVTYNARCCSSFFVDSCTSICRRGSDGAEQQNFADAERECFDLGMHICTIEELRNDQCCNEECSFQDFDDTLVWTRDPCNPQDFVTESEGGSRTPGDVEGASSGERMLPSALAIVGSIVLARFALN